MQVCSENNKTYLIQGFLKLFRIEFKTCLIETFFELLGIVTRLTDIRSKNIFGNKYQTPLSVVIKPPMFLLFVTGRSRRRGNIGSVWCPAKRFSSSLILCMGVKLCSGFGLSLTCMISTIILLIIITR